MSKAKRFCGWMVIPSFDAGGKAHKECIVILAENKRVLRKYLLKLGMENLDVDLAQCIEIVACRPEVAKQYGGWAKRSKLAIDFRDAEKV